MDPSLRWDDTECYNLHMDNRSGQVMIMTVTIVVGALVGASAVASSMMLRQIRQSMQSIDSTKAIFAAEAGIESTLYRQFKDQSYIPDSSLDESGASFQVATSSEPEGLRIKSVGKSKSSSRALEVRIAEVK